MSIGKLVVFTIALIAVASDNAAAQLSPTGSHYAGRATDTGTSSVSNMGGYSTAVPFDLIPARGGLPVPVAVTSGARGVGAAGLGWDIPISTIRRDVSLARRRPAYQPGAAATAREAIVLALNGQTFEMIPRRDDVGSTLTHRTSTQDGLRSDAIVMACTAFVFDPAFEVMLRSNPEPMFMTSITSPDNHASSYTTCGEM